MIFTAGQDNALEMLEAFKGDDEATVAIWTGFAGTGKSTLVRHVAKTMAREPIGIAPTGKAALRLRELTDLPTRTIHRFLYNVGENPKTGDPVFALKAKEDFFEPDGSLVVVDEASMIGPDVWADLRKAAALKNFKMLLVGDPFQLPPVQKDVKAAPFCVFDFSTEYRVHLSEVVRQAQESPIIRASMLIRAGQPEFRAMELLNAIPVTKQIETARLMHEKGGVTIAFTNKERHRINVEVRKQLGHQSDTVLPGEPLLVNKNNYKLDRFNGEIVVLGGWNIGPENDFSVTDRYTNSSMLMHFGIGRIDGNEAVMAMEEITGESDQAKIGLLAIKVASRRIAKNEFRREEPPSHLHANYGYTITGHRSQGSEWNETLVVIEGALRVMGAMERRRWIYTSLTRAKEICNYVYI